MHFCFHAKLPLLLSKLQLHAWTMWIGTCISFPCRQFWHIQQHIKGIYGSKHMMNINVLALIWYIMNMTVPSTPLGCLYVKRGSINFFKSHASSMQLGRLYVDWFGRTLIDPGRSLLWRDGARRQLAKLSGGRKKGRGWEIVNLKSVDLFIEAV